MTLYDVLGMPPGSSHADLRRAYLRAARRSHPDVYATADAPTRRVAEERMRSLNQAWAVLGHAERRRDYDRQLVAQQHLATHGAGRATAWGPAPGTAGVPPGWAAHRWARSAPEAGRAGFAGAAQWPGGPAAGQATGAEAWRSGPTAGRAAGADWRRFASPGPATQRTLVARLATLLPALLVGVALAVAALGVVMGSSQLVTLAGVAAVAASLGFLAAPILAMKEARRRQRRPTRAAPVAGFDGRFGP